MKRLSNCDQIDFCSLKTRTLCSSFYTEKFWKLAKPFFGEDPHVIVGLDSDHMVTIGQEKLREQTRPGTDIRHHKSPIKTDLCSENIKDRHCIAGSRGRIEVARPVHRLVKSSAITSQRCRPNQY